MSPDDPTRTRSPSGNTESSQSSVGPEERRIGRYVLEAEIGRGGMGVVYRARDPELERLLAIKIVRPPPGKQWPASRLLAEARALAKLRHPNVIPIFDVGTLGDAIYLVMPLVRGGTLRDWLHAETRGWNEVAQRFLVAGRGLAAAHGAGLVHRDFKPQNVLLEEDGHVLVADFGLVTENDPAAGTHGAAILETHIRGTPAYMAPEQADGRRVDARADQYSYCVSFWEGLRGRRPAEEETRDRGTSLALQSAAEASMDAPGWLLDALSRGLARDPERRWPSMRAIVEAIESQLDWDKAKTLPPRRWRWAFLVGAIAVASIGVPATILAMRARSDAETTPPTTVPPETAAVRTLTAIGSCARRPAFADKQMVVFEVPNTSGTSLFSISVDGTGLRPVSDGTESIGQPSRGRRAGEVLTISRGSTGGRETQIAVLDLYTTTRSVHPAPRAQATVAIGDEIYYVDETRSSLISLSGKPSWSGGSFEPDSLAGLAYDPRTQTVAHVGTTDSTVCRRRPLEERSFCSGRVVPAQTPAFSPSGDSVYIGDAEGVWRLDLKTWKSTLVVNGDASDGVTVSPDGVHIVWAGCRRNAPITDVIARPETVVTEDTDVEEVVAGAGTTLLWINGGVNGRELVVRNSTETRRISRATGELRTPVLDPSGTRVAFALADYKSGIHVMPFGADENLRISTDKRDQDPFWLDERTLLFHRIDASGTYAIRRARAEHNAMSVEVARNRRVLAVNLPKREVLLELHEAAGRRLMWWDPATNRTRPTSFDTPAHIKSAFISHNGMWLLVQSGSGGQLLSRAELPDGKLELVYQVDRERQLGRATIRDDGHVLVAPVELRGELSVMPLALPSPGDAATP